MLLNFLVLKIKNLIANGWKSWIKTMNDSVMNNLSIIKNSPFQILWQTGKNYYDQILSKKILFLQILFFFHL